MALPVDATTRCALPRRLHEIPRRSGAGCGGTTGALPGWHDARRVAPADQENKPVKNEIDPRPEQEATSKQDTIEAVPPENRRFLRVRTAVRAGAGMVCPLGEC